MHEDAHLEMAYEDRYVVDDPGYGSYGDIESYCAACGDVIDYCQGHGPIGDPVGHAILEQHYDGDHSECHPNADCED